MECEQGCGAFALAMTEIRITKSPRILLPRRNKTWVSPHIAGSPICSATQRDATFCRLRPSPNRTRCRKRPQILNGVNLLPRVQNAQAVLLKRLAQRKERVLQAGTARLVANACLRSNVSGE